MEKYFERLPKELQDLIRLAGKIAQEHNMCAFVTGGFVRDLILGVKNLDLDIVIEGDGIEFAQHLASALGAKLVRHKRFGTATIHSHNLKIDIATAREECYPQPACLPCVVKGALKDDLKRRDFTINAMAVSITASGFLKLEDFFGGMQDLRAKKVRVLHGQSFIDDPTRLLRAVRFEQRLKFKIEPHTLTLLKAAVKLKMLDKVQPQRTRDELILIFKEKKPANQIRRINQLAGFDFISKKIRMRKNIFVLLHSVEKQVNWFKKAYPERRKLDSWLVYFLCLIDPLSQKETQKICKRFCFTRGEEKRILSYKKINARFISSLKAPEISAAKIFGLLEPLSYEVIIMLKAKYKIANIQKRIRDFFEIYNGMRLHIRGEDLAKIGIPPGPFYKKVFTRVLAAKLNGLVRTKDEELALIKKLAAHV